MMKWVKSPAPNPEFDIGDALDALVTATFVQDVSINTTYLKGEYPTVDLTMRLSAEKGQIAQLAAAVHAWSAKVTGGW